MQLYVDMDGVLADFDTGHEAAFGWRPDKTADNVDWEAIANKPGFYLNLPPMPDLPQLWERIAPYRPIILTGIPSSVPQARNNKMAWALKNLPGTEVRCCLSKEKYQHAKPGDILIDDWEKYRHLWVGAGGIWITHTCAAETIRALNNLMVKP